MSAVIKPRRRNREATERALIDACGRLLLRDGADGIGVSRIGLRNGPKSHARPKKLEITYSSQVRTLELEDNTEMQWFSLPSITGFTGSGWGDVDVKILETYAGTKEGIAIAEVELKATTFDGM